MICHEEADRVYNLYADLEASFLELTALIGQCNGGSEFYGNQSLHLFWQHFGVVNRQLYRLLGQLTTAAPETGGEHCDTGAAGAASERPSPDSHLNGITP